MQTIALTRPLYRTLSATVPRARPLALSAVQSRKIAASASVMAFAVGAPPVAASRPGGWCWFANPRAVRYVGAHDRTYFAVLKGSGDNIIYQWDHDTDAVTSFTLHALLENDDHDNASILILPDGRLLVWYSTHVDTTQRQRISTNPEDISAWGAETSLDAQLGGQTYTYSNPVHLTGETGDPIYTFYRQIISSTWAGIWRSKSLDNGATWSAQEQIFARTPGQPIYWQLIQNGDSRIDFAVTDGHPDHTFPNGLYHVYYQGGNYYQSDGTLIVGGAPMEPSAGTMIHPGTPYPSWVWDMHIDALGRPIIAYSEIRGEFDHRYRYARWTGTAWQDNEVAPAGMALFSGEPAYSGGIAIDRLDPTVLYLSREIDGLWSMWRYVTANGGASWGSEQITDATTDKQARPVTPRNHNTDVRVLWWVGRYTSYTNYNVQMLSYPKVMR